MPFRCAYTEWGFRACVGTLLEISSSVSDPFKALCVIQTALPETRYAHSFTLVDSREQKEVVQPGEF